MHRTISLVITALLLAGCVNIAPGATNPPVRVPSLPPVNVPSLSIPTFPPINIPSLSIPSIPPINIPSLNLPSFPPIELPTGNAGGGLCRLITAAEVGTALGSQVSVTESSDTSCTFFSTTDFSTISLRTEATTLESAKILLDNPRDITVGSYPAAIGGFMGILLYIQRGGESLVVQAVLLENNEANQQKVIQIGTTAASRW